VSRTPTHASSSLSQASSAIGTKQIGVVITSMGSTHPFASSKATSGVKDFFPFTYGLQTRCGLFRIVQECIWMPCYAAIALSSCTYTFMGVRLGWCHG
jgi:hypothetical protein